MKGWSANCMFIFYIPLLCSFHVYCAAKDSLKPGEWIKDNGETLVSAGGEFELGFFTPNGSSGHKRYVGIWYTRDKQTVVWVANRDQPLINATGAFGFANDSFVKVWDTSSGECLIGLRDFWVSEYEIHESHGFWKPGETVMTLEGGSFTFRVDLVEDKKTLIIDKEGMIYWKSVDYGQNPLSKSNVFLCPLQFIQAEPSNNCSVYNFCGKFGSCNPNNKLACKCLPGFMPNVPQKWHSGDFSDGCVRNSIFCGDNDTFLSLKMMVVGENPNQKYDEDLVNLQEEHPDGNNLFVRVAISDIEQTVRNCKPCGTNMIPYPLSTSSNCGDPMYFSFDCNTTSGQVSFKAPSGTYRVTGIDPNTRMFLIQVKGGGNPWLNQSLPFNLTSPRNSSSKISSEVTDDVEIVWEPPLEPICNLPADCKDWPYSTCKSARDGKRRCLCNISFQWDGTKLNCTKVSLASGKRMTLPLIVGITSVIILCAIIFMYIWRRKMAKRQENRQIDQRNQAHRIYTYNERHVQDLIDAGEFNEEDEKGIDVPFYDLESILVATDNFSNENKLGQGGYGPVFKGKLPSGQEIAVKRLSSVSSQGLQEFKNEVVLIAKLQHRNLVRLYGYCIKGNEKILLYDGYMSPEYALDGIFSIKSDVFSFGVVLLEIISGRKNTGFYQSELAMSLLGYAWRLWTDNKMLDLMDETLRETCIADQFVKCINIGLLCVQDDPSDRPTMSNVIKMLDSEITNLPTPKQPAFFITRDQSSSTSSNRPESNNDINK
uniref:Receptor-like serine/threonine-protein kinase n=1 Tax=Fagus sylvatica TaxID=28930 RepID=A0A2N9FQW7_FAGSY